MKWVILLLLFNFFCQPFLCGWTSESRPNKGDAACREGEALTGVLLKYVDYDGESNPTRVSEFKKITVRAQCSNLDEKNGGPGMKDSSGTSKKAWTLREGCKITDLDKNCGQDEFIVAIKLADSSGTPSVTLVCSKHPDYTWDTTIEARIIGPMRFTSGQPCQIDNPRKSTDEGQCQPDVAVAIGVDDVGVKLKIVSLKKNGAEYKPSCNTIKQEAVGEANKYAISEPTGDEQQATTEQPTTADEGLDENGPISTQNPIETSGNVDNGNQGNDDPGPDFQSASD